jgi:hypothetical protein
MEHQPIHYHNMDNKLDNGVQHNNDVDNDVGNHGQHDHSY